MYCKFYGLKERPFSGTADPAFFFLSARHKEALSHLLYGVSQRKGIVVLTGEIGTGKTTLCRFFLKQLGENVRTAFILNPDFAGIQLLHAIVMDFGIKPKKTSRIGLIWELNKLLLRETGNGNNVVLIIDEAQNLKPGLLEQIRLLSNLETEKEKLLQIVLVGQPELNQRLNLYDLRQLKQRIMVNYHITPLQGEEIRDYVRHRLNIAGGGSRIKFTDRAIDEISNFSLGTPRLINTLCDRALLAAFVEEKNIVDLNVIDKAIKELQ